MRYRNVYRFQLYATMHTIHSHRFLYLNDTSPSCACEHGTTKDYKLKKTCMLQIILRTVGG